MAAAAPALPNCHPDRQCRHSYGPWTMQHSKVRVEKNLSNPGLRLIPYGISKVMQKANREMKRSNPVAETRRAIKVVKANDPPDPEHFRIMPLPPKSTHRDGAIYMRKDYFRSNLRIDITDRNETPLEPDPENCLYHMGCQMMQIFSLKLAKAPNSGPLQLYGFIGARDDIDFKLNYVFNRSRDDPITVQQGSLIEMTGPKRGISMDSPVLIEYDMRIKNGEKEEDDLQLIDGAMDFHDLSTSWTPFTCRIVGDCGAVDVTLALVHSALEATVEVFISDVQSSFDLSLSSFVLLMDVRQEIQHFHGTIDESRGLRRFVLAVLKGTMIHLKFKVGQQGSNSDVVHVCSFISKFHGSATRQIKLEHASISVKVNFA
ncbi:hypothetical protein ACP70R_023186 [Stipagrostis hirtigluma subsp. patula]